MPELPDLTVYSANLASKLNGKKVQSVKARISKRLNVPPRHLQKALANASLEDVQRTGKEILFQFSNNSVLLVHLMLAGGFAITKTPRTVKYPALTIAFKGGTALVITDPRSLVSVKLNPSPSKVPDALDIDVD